MPEENLLKRLLCLSRWTCGVLVAALSMPLFLCAQGRKDRIVVVLTLDGFPAYALQDPRLPIPTLRRLAREGLVADSMQPVNPTVTWPNHTTLVTGVDSSVHRVLFNGLLTYPEKDSPPKIEPWRDKDLLVHSPTVYDVAHEAGLTTAQVDWVAIYNAKNIDWNFPELPDPNGAIERALIADGTVTAEQLKTFEASSQAWQDEIWTDAAVKILAEHRPNLLLIHLLTLDDINHAYGPMSQASFTAIAYLDSLVNRIVRVLEGPDFSKRATLLIVSDHGFRAYEHAIHANSLLQEKGIVTSVDGRLKGDAYVVPEGGLAMVYVRNEASKSQLLQKLRSAYSQAEGIEKVYESADFASLGLPVPADSDQAPDMVLVAKPGYAFSGEPEGNFITDARGGTHGFLNSDPQMRAIFSAWGNGVPRGVRLGGISNRDVAPTIAKLLGLRLERAQGHAISGIE